MMRNVLILAYDFPPRGTTSVIRVAKFARYLPDFGWQPVVVTATVRGGQRDERLLSQLPRRLEVIRVPNPFAPGEAASSPHSARPTARARLRSAARRMFVPDAQILWTPAALEAAAARLRRGDIAAVFSTAPPFSVHIAALLLKRRFAGLPWVMDLRDIWSENPAIHSLPAYRLQRELERRCLAAADQIVTATDGQRRLLEASFPFAAAKLNTITNGFDPADVPPAVPRAPGGPLRLSHAGSIVGNRAAAARGLFAALVKLAERGVTRQQLEVRLVGIHDPLIYSLAAPLEASGLVRLLPPVPYHEAWNEMRSAGALLLLSSDDREGRLSHPNKLFEYWAAGRPVLALTPDDGDVARLVRASGVGSALSPGDVDAIVAALQRLIEQGDMPGPAAPTGGLRRWERRELTQKLAALFDRVAARVADEPAHA